MVKENHYKGVKHVVYVSTGDRVRCEHCERFVGGDLFADSVNHYIEEHGYKVLHVGAETSRDMEGKPWDMTVAVLGR